MREIVLPRGEILGFKALPQSLSLDRNSDYPPSNWSALYPQLSLRNALSYLPNQFDRGFSEVYLAKMVAKVDFHILVYDDPLFKNGKISNSEKAGRLWDAFSSFSEDKLLDPTLPLMPALGAIGYSVCILDAEDYELAVPHNLLSTQSVDVVPLFKVRENSRYKGVIGSIDGLNIQKSVLENINVELAIILESNVDKSEASFILKHLSK